MDVFNIWYEQKGKDNSTKCQHMHSVILNELNTDDKIGLEEIQQSPDVVVKFQKSGKKLTGLPKLFLQKIITGLFYLTLLKQEEEVEEPTPSTSASFAGRKCIAFEESSERTKRRKTKQIRELATASELSYAAQMSLRSEGETETAKLLSEATTTTPTRASRIRKAWTKRDEAVESFTSDEALALFVDTKLTKAQYIKIRVQAKLKHADIYPSYNKLRAAKEQCYPPRDLISESLIEIKLQALLNLTTTRLVQSQQEIFNITPVDMPTELILISKWGCDGSTGHSKYKQKSKENLRDIDMFITSLVPLQLYVGSSKKQILWQNPRPSSVRYCRPIRIQYKKETTELIQTETSYIQKQIEKLEKTQIIINNRPFFVKHEMVMTMIDGKVCNAVT